MMESNHSITLFGRQYLGRLRASGVQRAKIFITRQNFWNRLPEHLGRSRRPVPTCRVVAERLMQQKVGGVPIKEAIDELRRLWL